RQTDPKIEIERFGEAFSPIFSDSRSGNSPHELIQKESKRPRVISVRASRRPIRFLFLERIDDGFVIEHVHFLIQRGESRLMRKQLRERDLVFSGLAESRPELPHSLLDVDLVFLQNVQKTCAAESFGRRPNQNESVIRPGSFASSIPESAVKIDNRFSVLPN